MSVTNRPNVLLIMVDQLAAAWLPAYGFSVASTPTLDALAERATVFDSAYCPSPLCAPSRASLLTGRLPSRTGVYDNAAEMPSALPTIAHHLRALGYRTALSGKMHFVGADQLHGFEERLTTDVYPADLDWTPDWDRPMAKRFSWYHSLDSVREPARCRASMQMDYDDEVGFRAVRKIFQYARDRSGAPFFLTASFTHPHDPWEIRPEYWDRYHRYDVPLPEVGRLPLADADPYSRRLRELSGLDVDPPSDDQVREARHGYLAAVSYVDERIGEILHALDVAGFAHDTIVAFTADHGEMLGERGLWYKMSFFEQSASVPLMIHVPGRTTPVRVAAPVSLLDLLPTALDLVDGTPEPDTDGVSLASLLDGTSTERTPVTAEYLGEGVIAPAVMVRRGPYKLIRCLGDPDQLYDLASDPAELHNLAGDPAYAATVRELADACDTRVDLAELDLRVRSSQRDRHLVAPAMRQGRYAPWDFQPFEDASEQYVRTHADMYELQQRYRLEA